MRQSLVHLAALGLFFACTTPPPEAPAAPEAVRAPQPPAAEVAESPSPPAESVKPGINDEFLSPELDVGRFVGIFEGESREIARQRDEIVRALGLRGGEELADVGAGTGLFLEAFATAVGAEGRVFAVDLSPRFLDFLRERVRLGDLANVEVVACSERSVELPVGAIDVAFLCDTYHHFEYPEDSLASIHRALRARGALVVVDFERVPGLSRPWILEHVRAGKEAVSAEIQAAGFELEAELPAGLAENYMLRFRKR